MFLKTGITAAILLLCDILAIKMTPVTAERTQTVEVILFIALSVIAIASLIIYIWI